MLRALELALGELSIEVYPIEPTGNAHTERKLQVGHQPATCHAFDP